MQNIAIIVRRLLSNSAVTKADPRRIPVAESDSRLREAYDVCDEQRDVAAASLIETWIDETERRTWVLFETCQPGDLGR